ncbi:MAG TPA: hypothetical protein VFD58_06990 [Blastocatellia bacterium]|nr:hypothetical protein [Blastocatellia bacterium]
MTEVHFTDITISGNSISRPPRKEGRNKEGKDQFIITFSLSGHAKGPWIETFNRLREGRSRQVSSLQLPTVSDDQIHITCPLDDQLQDQLDNLKRVVATTNQMYREHLQAIEDEKSSSDEILHKLRF